MPKKRNTSTSDTKYLQVNYKIGTREGRIINYFRDNHEKRSEFVRNWIVNCFSYRYFVDQGGKPIERIQACLDLIDNLEKQLEQVRSDLQKEITRRK
jgi:hypothetical protein